MTTTWHAQDDLLARYAAGRADDVAASSLEAHLVSCATCRARLGERVPRRRLATNWAVIELALDAPGEGLTERLLVRAGLRQSTARLLGATPTLRWSWLASVTIALLFSLAATARPESAAIVFLLLAPLVPLAGVAVAFNRSLDPSAEMFDATPLGGLPLTLLRTIASAVPSMVIAGVTGLLVTSVGDTWPLWLLPALALSALSLLLSFLAPIGTVSLALGAVWAVAVVVAEAAARGSFRALRSGGPPESLLVHQSGQLLVGAVAVAGAVGLITTFHSHIAPGRHA